MTKLINLEGGKFGRLTVISRADNHVSKNGNSRPAWLCRCDCGNELIVLGLNLTRGHTISCGCARKTGREKLMVDVTGQRFGKLVAIRHVDNEKKGTYWLFKCDCGATKEMLLQNVKSGKSTSCGRCKSNLGIATNNTRGIVGNTYNLTGQRFDRLVAIERIVDEKRVIYLCKCDCGNECIKSTFSLLYGTKINGTNSCGCVHNEAVKRANLVGRRFTHLVVEKPAESKYGKLHWVCRCDCGNETVVSSGGLLSGHTKSCGCYQDEVASNTHFQDLSGRRFDLLTVVRREKDGSRGEARYLCRCDCGNEKVIVGASLVSGLTHSCGCMAQSVGEMIIDRILNSMGLKYKTQVKFTDLTGIGEYPLSFDFGVYDNKDELIFLIEYQGQQHYKPVDYFGGEEKFQQQQFHDELKREYAEEYIGVPLLEIPYTEDTEEKIYNSIRYFCSEKSIQTSLL